MQIVLMILQVLGIILLVLLGIIFLALCLLLFCPVRYLIDVHWIEEEWGKFQASWLFRILKANVTYEKNIISVTVRLLFKKMQFTYDLTEEKKEEPKKEKKKKESTKESIISKIKGKIETIKEVYPKIIKILKDEKNKEALTHLKKELIYLLKLFLPKKSKIQGSFSTGSPDTTGQAFGILACFPAMYEKNWSIIPDFTSDEMYFKGTIWAKGRIYGFQLFGIILRILFDKNCRRLYTILNRFKKWLKRNDNVEDNINE